MNRRLLDLLADRGKDALLKAGRDNTYREYLMGNSNFGQG